jgi:hypothetical protein
MMRNYSLPLIWSTSGARVRRPVDLDSTDPASEQITNEKRLQFSFLCSREIYQSVDDTSRMC